MGLSGFQRARRLAAEKASVPAETLSYDQAIAILAQPLLATEPQPIVAEETPEPVPPRTVRKPKPTK